MSDRTRLLLCGAAFGMVAMVLIAMGYVSAMQAIEYATRPPFVVKQVSPFCSFKRVAPKGRAHAFEA